MKFNRQEHVNAINEDLATLREVSPDVERKLTPTIRQLLTNADSESEVLAIRNEVAGVLKSFQ